MHEQYFVCLLDYDLGDNTGLTMLKQAAPHYFNVPHHPARCGRGSYEIDQEALRAGAMDSRLRFHVIEVVL